MRQGIHPDYHPVVFRDASTGDEFLSRSTATSSQTIEWEDGRRYPLLVVDVSRYSHPFWTGTARILDTEGQIEKFNRRYGRRPTGSGGTR